MEPRASRDERFSRALASPVGVLILVPALVIAAGVVVMLFGRSATREGSEAMARTQLAAQATDIQHDVAFALDQAAPLMISLRPLTDRSLPIEECAVRLRDIVVSRPGIANVSITFPDGMIRGTYIDIASGELQVQESIVTDHGTERANYSFTTGAARVISRETSTYDGRTRPHFIAATQAGTRVWLPPRVFFTSHKTGLTVTEPVFDAQVLRAVTTVDFDVIELSSFIARAPFEGARTVMFAADGTILAFPAAKVPAAAQQENRLLRHQDFDDPALEALFARLGDHPSADELQFLQLKTRDGEYLASLAPIGGKRAGIAAPLDWYLATLVPERVLLGATRTLEKRSLLASGGALLVAMGVALMFAWNLVRMRRAVGAARERARSAEARVKELGSYRLVTRLGAGGMGEVWRAEHRLLAREAAIKLVRPEVLRDALHAPAIRERFRREAQTLASMRSQHTIALYDYGVTDDGTFFYVMELLDGVDLDKMLREHGPQPAARVIHLLIQACQSLAEAHDAGLLHRDIKPANLFACRAADEVDVLKVLDFGIVQATKEPHANPVDVVSLPAPGEAPIAEARPAPSTERLTQVGAVVGTPGFIAPEQAFGGEIDGRADLYALACVAWWLLAGGEVFTRGDDDEILRAHIQDPVPSLRARMTGWLPDGLDKVIVACLAKRAEDRPANARALIAALRAIEIPAEHAWTAERATTWWKIHRPPATGAAPQPPSADTASIERLLVPHHEEPVAAIGPEAATVEQKRSERGVRR